MNKKILLVEPSYQTKYPPLGLMKLSSYHRLKGDEITFIKGCDNEANDKEWDRIYITTLFTWTWNETIKTIDFYSTLFHPVENIFVGGILATLMPQDLRNAVAPVNIITGRLDNPRKIDQEDEIIIDDLAPDYEILKQVENNNFKYSNTDAYIGYATRGCVNHCKYCAVNTLEPKFVPYINLKKLVGGIDSSSGEKQNLLLMDNNVLASPNFNEIIDDIKSAGFYKGATFGPTKRKRVVDFNQGLDARLLTQEKMQRLADIPLEPMRIAFDDIKLKKIYIKAVKLAHKYGQRDMSNYILYNYKDTPDDFYERLKINIELNEEFRNNTIKTAIYSFPMRYIPLNSKNRNKVETGNIHWNKRYLRAMQVILNVTKGPVMPGADFFYQAYGDNAEEFKMILAMPDSFIRNRLVDNWREKKTKKSRQMPYVNQWITEYKKLNDTEKQELINILSTDNKLKIIEEYKKSLNKKLKKLLQYHVDEEKIVGKYINDAKR